jgi:hypothetical protein
MPAIITESGTDIRIEKEGLSARFSTILGATLADSQGDDGKCRDCEPISSRP